MDRLIDLAQRLLEEVTAYQEKPTKACSFRIRKLTQELNNVGPAIRKELVAADKAGY